MLTHNTIETKGEKKKTKQIQITNREDLLIVALWHANKSEQFCLCFHFLRFSISVDWVRRIENCNAMTIEREREIEREEKRELK